MLFHIQVVVADTQVSVGGDGGGGGAYQHPGGDNGGQQVAHRGPGQQLVGYGVDVGQIEPQAREQPGVYSKIRTPARVSSS